MPARVHIVKFCRPLHRAAGTRGDLTEIPQFVGTDPSARSHYCRPAFSGLPSYRRRITKPRVLDRYVQLVGQTGLWASHHNVDNEKDNVQCQAADLILFTGNGDPCSGAGHHPASRRGTVLSGGKWRESLGRFDDMNTVHRASPEMM